MGEYEARDCGFEPLVLDGVTGTSWGERLPLLPDGAPLTTADDTVAAARALRDMGVDLLLFAGGDGTARDVCRAVDAASSASACRPA